MGTAHRTRRSITNAAPAKFWIGPSGWSYPDWHGVFYPARKPRGFNALAFIARYFNAVEVNSSFYALPRATMTAKWPEQTPPEFRFAFKLTRIFTHEHEGVATRADATAFLDALRPVREAAKLGPLLIQFPWSFRFSPENRDRLRRLADLFTDVERFFEVRHTSWANPDALAAIRAAGGYCNIDQPLLRDCLPPTSHVFGRSAYVRLHGRNAANWFATGKPAFERYNYLYSEPEIREWIGRLHETEKSADEVYVFTNNHYRGQGPANALELKAILEDRKVPAPAPLLATFPRLAQWTEPASAPPTPAPSTPAPSTPAPHTPAPSTPAPSTPAPSTPAPPTPAPPTPAPSTREPYHQGDLFDQP